MKFQPILIHSRIAGNTLCYYVSMQEKQKIDSHTLFNAYIRSNYGIWDGSMIALVVRGGTTTSAHPKHQYIVLHFC
jgi:hypothetical protein